MIKQIKDYTVFPVTLVSKGRESPVEGVPESVHYMYVKKHVSKSQADTQSRSLFIVNVPVGADFNSMKKLLSDVALGANIEDFQKCEYYDVHNKLNFDLNVNLSKLSNEDFGQELPNTGIPVGCGVVRFLDKEGMKLALSQIRKLDTKVPMWEVLTAKKTGLAKYGRDRTWLDSQKLTKDVAKAMAKFETREREVAEELQQTRETVDEDGFTVVVGPHRKTKSGIMGSLKRKEDLEHNAEYIKKREKKQKHDFYRFQIREQKKQEVNELLEKFKEDQKRVQEMREKRKFNPYQ